MKRMIPIAVALALSACGGGSPASPTPPAPPAPPPITVQSDPPPDDYPAVQALLNQGGTVQLDCRDYYFSATLIPGVSGTTLKGCGATTVLHWTPPANPVECKNGSAIQVMCGLGDSPHEITLPIAIGDTSMTVADATGINAGDWLMIGDWGVLGTYTAVVDWVQVASVDGDVVSFEKPSRIAVQSYGQPFVPFQSGMGYVKPLNLHDVTLEDFIISIDGPAPKGGNFPGIGVVGTRNTTIQGVTVEHPQGNPFFTYFSQGTRVVSNHFGASSPIASEVASSVDVVVQDNVSGSDISLDLGTAFFQFTDNAITEPTSEALYVAFNVHDGVIARNQIGYVAGGNSVGIYLRGSPNVQVTDNTFAGGSGVGILIRPADLGLYNFPDTGDVLSGNTIQGFATEVSGP